MPQRDRLLACVDIISGCLAESGRLPQCIANHCRRFSKNQPRAVHRTLGCTSAMAAGVTDRLWSVEELIDAVPPEQRAAEMRPMWQPEPRSRYSPPRQGVLDNCRHST